MKRMSSTIENGLLRQAALPHFSPNLTALKLKISNFESPNYSCIFLKLWIRRIFRREFTEFNSLATNYINSDTHQPIESPTTQI